ncbi:MAG TPA: sortase [Candidatus Limnocylindrales bacterium]|nr:sortase [Candidatus Limnocylindrales bacterium]
MPAFLRSLGRAVRERVIPAVLTAAGVTLLAAGLLHYGAPALARPEPSASPASAPTTAPIGFVPPSLPPLLQASLPPPTPAPTPDPHRVATRVVIEALDIDLAIVPQPSGYPWCNVAMYLKDTRLGQPGSGKSVYLYAHARDGMFGPLYERVTLGRHGGAKSLTGMVVAVYTSDDHLYEYQVTRVYPRVPADTHFLDRAFAVTSETLWLQTSTGHGGELPKLQVVAKPFFDEPAAHADAHPKARPIACG